MNNIKKISHHGHCHCQAVQFDIQAPSNIKALQCNCSICSMTGFLHLIVQRSDFRLIQGEQVLQRYEFNSKKAKHLFCKYCGVKSFYIPRSHPDAYSVNVNCLDKSTLGVITLSNFDGQHWEESIAQLQLD